MKRFSLSIIVISLLLAAFVAPHASAQSADPAPSVNPAAVIKIGTVDIKRIVAEHPVSVAWTDEFTKIKIQREEELRKNFMTKFSVKDETELTREQQIEAQEFMVEENKKFNQEIMLEENKRLQLVEDDIFKYAAIIAKEKGFALILDRTAIIYGETMDITDILIERIKNK